MGIINLPIFATAFIFIFIAALPGRTTFVMLIMAARERPWGVFLGSALAFFCQSAISVLLGHVLVLFPQHWVRLVTGLLFIFFACMFWRESRHDILAPKRDSRNSFSAVVRSSFLVVFAAEWGDVSQVAIASSVAQTTEQFTVFLSSAAALWLIAGLAVVAGSRLHTVMNPKIIQKFASITFFAIGIYFCTSSIFGLTG